MIRVSITSCVVLTALALAPTATAAPPSARMRVVVRVVSSDDLARSTRLRGQTSDLAVELQDAPSTALEPRLRDQIAAADLLVRQLGADVAIWFPGREALVYVAKPAPGHVLRLSPEEASDAGAAGASSRYEQTALKLRRVLKTLLDGGVVGVPRDDLEDERTAALPASRPAPMPTEGKVRVVSALGVAQLFDGIGSTTGIAARAGLGLGGNEWALTYDEYLHRELTSSSPARRAARRSFGAAAALRLLDAAAVRALATARAGFGQLALHAGDRESHSEDESGLHPYVGAGGRMDVPLFRCGSGPVTLRFWVEGTLEWLWDPPVYKPGFPHSGERATDALQPRVALGLSLEGG